jgi:hypothetical protein
MVLFFAGWQLPVRVDPLLIARRSLSWPQALALAPDVFLTMPALISER